MTYLPYRKCSAPPEASYLLTTGDGCWGTPLHVAIYLDNIEAVNLLLQAGVDVAANTPVHKQRLSPLALAACVGNRRLLWRLWKHLRSQPEANNIPNVDSCLFQASMNGQIPILRALLDWWEWTAEAKNEALFWVARSWKDMAWYSLCSDALRFYVADLKPLRKGLPEAERRGLVNKVRNGLSLFADYHDEKIRTIENETQALLQQGRDSINAERNAFLAASELQRQAMLD